MLDGGVLEDNPLLRIGILEAGCGWLPYWLWRLDEVEYRKLGPEVAARVRKPPSSYFRSQCWIAVEAGEPLLDGVVACVGPDRFVFGTDFPHLDHDMDWLDQRAGSLALDASVLRGIYWDNPLRLLGLRAPGSES